MTVENFNSEIGINPVESLYSNERERDKAIEICEYPILIELDGIQYNIEVESGYRKIILRPTNKCVI